jgi:hypothetical protein
MSHLRRFGTAAVLQPAGMIGGPELKMDIFNTKGESCMFLAKLK